VILVDTSAWIEFDRATGSGVNRRVRELIATNGPLAVSEPIVMEVVAGARDDRRERQLRRLLQRFELLPFDAAIDFDAAARIYRRCRAAGVAPRGMIDCMVTSIAQRAGASVLAHDADVARVARVIKLDLDPASLGG
jgi:hypothetical protein